MHHTLPFKRLAVLWRAGLLIALLTPCVRAQGAAPECAPPIDTAARGRGPSLAIDHDPAVRFLVGDSVRIGLTLNDAPPGEPIRFVAAGIDRAIVDDGNVLRWLPQRGSVGTNYVTVMARQGTTTLACRQARLIVDRVQRAPVIRISSKQVQAGATLDFQLDARDPDGDSLTYAVSDMSHGIQVPTIDSTGRFRWRAPVSASTSGTPYQFKVEVSDGINISAAIFAVVVSGQNVRPECPLTVPTIVSSEGASTLVPLAATDANGDVLRYRPERELVNGRIDSVGYRWEIPYGTVERGATEQSIDFQWRAIDEHNAQSDLCTTRVTVRARMEPEKLRAEQAAHVRFFTNAGYTEQELAARVEDLRDRINSHDDARRRRSIISLATALIAGTFQLAKAEDTRRIAGGLNTLTSVFFAGYNALAPGTDGLKSEARKFEDELAKYSQLLAAFRVSYGDTVTEQVLRSTQYRADRTALDVEQSRAAALLR
ncbi:MAG: hypothetical protein U5K74_02030 [Gemmatimonadaceae bacterium]|nr:hypothetical protein [Gemmatimonadaceae bacterium]